MRRSGNLAWIFDVVEVAAALGGETCKQPLVEVLADAKCRRRDARGFERRGLRRQRVRVGEAVVGEAVGEEQHAVWRGLRALEPSAGEVGPAARVNGGETLQRAGLRLGRGRGTLEQQIDLRVIDDEREVIASVEEPDGVVDGLAGHGDLRTGHGA